MRIQPNIKITAVAGGFVIEEESSLGEKHLSEGKEKKEVIEKIEGWLGNYELLSIIPRG